MVSDDNDGVACASRETPKERFAGEEEGEPEVVADGDGDDGDGDERSRRSL